MHCHRPFRSIAVFALVISAGCVSDDVNEDSETGANTSSPTSSANTMSASGNADGSAGDGSVELGCAAGAIGETTDGAMNSVMETWGAPCTTDAQCVELIGDPEAVCDTMAVVFELPGGYCTKPCSLPDPNTQFVLDAPDCSAEGGVTCIGSMGAYERCAITCTDDQQCSRDGYICRQLPLIAMPDDPRSCLMPDCCQGSC